MGRSYWLPYFAGGRRHRSIMQSVGGTTEAEKLREELFEYYNAFLTWHVIPEEW